ncbi:MAG: alpha/beta fold hydrolase [Saprospiraceae bacterium]|nr:alpha/beta fold hydrolase [Saprospiraceae bacterium]
MDRLITFISLAVFVGTSFGQKMDRSFDFYSSEKNQYIKIADSSIWELQRMQILKNLESVMGALPHRTKKSSLDIQISDTLIETRYTRYTLTFLAAENERVPAYLYIPMGQDLPKLLPAMVALHPTGMAGKKIVDGEGLANRGYARELAERGYVVIAPDYPSFGDLENFDFTTTRYASGTMAAIFYHMCCVDLLTQRNDVDQNKIGVIGHSLGGHNAMFLGAFDDRLKIIISSCGWTQMEFYDVGPSALERYGGRLGPWAQDRYMPRIRDVYSLDGHELPFNFHEIVALLAPRLFFSNSPLNDSNFAVSGVVKGIEEVKEVYQLYDAEKNLVVRYPEAEHDFPIEIRMEAYQTIDRLFNYTPLKLTME